LTAEEQRTVLVHTQGASEELAKCGFSKLAAAEHLLKIRDILLPKRVFKHFLRHNFPTCSVATAYRWIESYETAKQNLPDGVMQVAMAQGYHVIDAEMVKKAPPPRTQDRSKIVAYLSKLSTMKREVRTAELSEPNADDLMRECFNFCVTRFEKLPEGGTTRSRCLYSLFGMLMFQLGFGVKQEFEPLEVPPGYRAVRGRPKLNATA